ncbi:microsomal glutathione S-transferase 1-like [Aedes aegypti]|uniref:Microsomal glutathione S-transferase 1 n=1 Tax=Aedes aegypti TaxID=7159 RepID=A0A1S4FPF3_AEDAE|nr:microsomal glutathione S-transferase 1 [Aedes aegypti]XP_021712605.1 microsomal glutathione S-transferase 1-like [Aedes aegypti]
MSNFFDTIDPTIFRSYIFWCSVLGLKMLVMSVLTGMKRHAKKAFANPEDAPKGVKVVTNDPDVERVRRAHLNDLENILPFFIIAFLYMFTNPSVFVATNLFRAVALARIVHTLVYAVFVIPQPARGLSWMVGFFSTGYMAVKTILAFL